MKKLKFVLVAVATVVLGFTSQATITNAAWWAAHDGAIICDSWNWNSGQSALTMHGAQYSAPGSMVGVIRTTDPLDPTLTLSGALNNDTGNAWIGYTINVILATNFSFVAPGPTVSNPSVNDWFVASVVNPTLQLSGPNVGLWEGTLNFSGGTPIGVGGEMDYLYSINFSGLTVFNFTQEMIPIFAAIPEPSALALGGIGALLLAWRRSRRPCRSGS
jgi:hypothetical protein